MVDIINAAPMVIDLGTNDLSTRLVPLSPLEIPQHLPKIYVFAEKGPIGPTYVDFDQVSLTQLYGEKTFDVNGPFYSHQTPYLQAIAAAGNNCVVHRLPGTGMKDVANIAMYLDVLPTTVPVYQKSVDGSIVLDVNGNPVQAVDANNTPITVSGYKVAWVLDTTSAALGSYTPGLLAVRPGVQTDGVNNSTQYPIFELAADSPGSSGNTLGIRMYPALASDITPFPSNLLNDGKVYPYYFQLVRLTDTATGKVNFVYNSFGAQSSKFITKQNGIDPSSGAIIDINKVLNDQYINLPPNLKTGLGRVFVYNNNLNTVLTNLYNAEKAVIDTHRDTVINSAENNIHALNIISFTSSNNSPYQAIKLVDIANISTRLTKNTNVFLRSGDDGTMSISILDSLVAADLDNYNNPQSEYNDLVMHPESVIYDSGFSISTKIAMTKFIARRKDTFVILSTYAYNAPAMTAAEQYSVGLALKSAIDLYPESATFGTPVMRGVICAGSGIIINSLYTNRVPLTYEVAYKSSRYMGAKTGAWKNGFAFDRAPLSVVSQLKDIDVTWYPTSTRNTLWSTGINFVLNYKVNTQFFPALQTVYENDTSVLNSYFTAIAIAYLNKIAHAAWREFSGSISLTNAQLEEKVNTFVANAVKDKFDGKFVIQPNATVTELDNLRGYSWTLPIKIYANNMKTVMTTYVEAHRMTDLAA